MHSDGVDCDSRVDFCRIRIVSLCSNLFNPQAVVSLLLCPWQIHRHQVAARHDRKWWTAAKYSLVQQTLRLCLCRSNSPCNQSQPYTTPSVEFGHLTAETIIRGREDKLRKTAAQLKEEGSRQGIIPSPEEERM